MDWVEVYVALGGNIGDSRLTLKESLKRIKCLEGVKDMEISPFYLTSPVSDIPQNDYINAVCRFKTCLKAAELLIELQMIEKALGKEAKQRKDPPRIIDLDILFFGEEFHQESNLEVPHPRWKERLFVLAPLADLTDQLMVPDRENGVYSFDLANYLKEYTNPNNETVVQIEEVE